MAEPAAAVADRPMIEMRNLNKWYGEFHVLTNVNFVVRKGEKVVVCGPSGSDRKSTRLNSSH